MKESEQRLAAIVTSALDAILVVDEEQSIVLFNAAAERTFGCSAGEAIGSKLDRFIPQGFREEDDEGVRQFGHPGITNPKVGTLVPYRPCDKRARNFRLRRPYPRSKRLELASCLVSSSVMSRSVAVQN